MADLVEPAARLIENPPAAPSDLADIERRAQEIRRRRRRRRVALPCLAVILAVGGIVAVIDRDQRGAQQVTLSQDGATPDVLVVTCTSTDTSVASASVVAARDGVHVRVDDRSGRSLQVRTEHVAPETEPSSKFHVVGEGESLVAMPPGTNLVLCSEQEGPEHILAPSQSPEAVKVEIVDAGGNWRSLALDCGGQAISSTISDHYPSGPGDVDETTPEPERVVREHFRWLRPGDTVEVAGYRGDGGDRRDSNVSYRVVGVDGRTIATASLKKVSGRWVVEGSEECAGTRDKPGSHCPRPEWLDAASPTKFESDSGSYPVFVTGIDVERRTITFDMFQTLSGEAGRQAYYEDTGDLNGPPGDYWNRNESPELRSAPVARAVQVWLVRLHEDGNPEDGPATFEELPDYAESQAKFMSPEAFRDEKYERQRLFATQFFITLERGEVIRICERYVP